MQKTPEGGGLMQEIQKTPEGQSLMQEMQKTLEGGGLMQEMQKAPEGGGDGVFNVGNVENTLRWGFNVCFLSN